MAEMIFGLVLGVLFGVVLASPSKEKLLLVYEMAMNKMIVAGEFELDGRRYKIIPADVVARGEK